MDKSNRLIETKKITKEAFVMSSSRLLSGILGAISTVILMRFLTPNVYGQARISMSVAGIIVLLSDLGVGQSSIRFFSELKVTKKYYLMRDLLYYLAFIRVGIASILAFLLFSILTPLASLLGIAETQSALVLASIWIPFASLNTLLVSFLTGLRKLEYIATTRLTGSVILSGSLAYFVFARFGADGIILASLISEISVCLIFIALLVREFSAEKYFRKTGDLSNVSNELLKEILRFCGYIFMTDILMWFPKKYIVLLLSILGTPTDVGYFSAALEISTPFNNLIATGLSSSLYPAMSESYSSGNLALTRFLHKTYTKTVSAIMIPTTIGLAVIMPVFLRIAFPKYLSFLLGFQILSARVALGCIALVQSRITLIALGKARERMQIVLIQVLLTIGLASILVPTIGVLGAAVANVLGILFGTVISYVTVENNIKDGIGLDFWVKSAIASLIMSFSVLVILHAIESDILSLILGIVTGILVYGLVFLRLKGVTRNEFNFLESGFSNHRWLLSVLRTIEKIQGAMDG